MLPPLSPLPLPPLLSPYPQNTLTGAASGEGPLLSDYREHSTDVSVHFDLELVAGKMAACLGTAGGLPAKFKLNTKISTGGCVLVCVWLGGGRGRRQVLPNQSSYTCAFHRKGGLAEQCCSTLHSQH